MLTVYKIVLVLVSLDSKKKINHQIAQELAEEFFEQGDFERSRLQQQPIELMDRDLKHKLPSMQVGFIDAICMPLYEVIFICIFIFIILSSL